MRQFVGVVQFLIRGFDAQLSALGHRVARVHRKVHDDLFDLAHVRANRAEVARQIDCEIDVFADQPRNQLAHFFHDGIQIDRARLQHLHAAEGEKLAREGRSTVGRAVDLFDLSPRFVFGRQSAQQ